MKKLFSLLLITISIDQASSNIYASSLKTAQTFMFTQPVYHNIQATNFLWRDVIPDNRVTLRVVPMYQESFNGAKTAKYFLLNCRSDILIAGDNTTFNTERDVRAEWLELPSTFSGVLSIRPHQKQYGALLSYNQNLYWLPWEFFANSWVEISMPIIKVVNKINPVQCNSSNTAGPVTGHEIIDAFNRSSMLFGKISPNKQSIFGVGELRAVFGTTWTTKNDFLLQYYGGIAIPTSKKQIPCTLFNPVIGLNSHTAMVAGVNIELPLQPEDWNFHAKVYLLADANYLYPNHQLRTLSLFKNQWSQYLMLRRAITQPDGTVIGDTTATPAVNVLTQTVRVRANCFANLATGISLDYHGWNLELGYQFWVHTTERLSLCKPNCSKKPFLFHEYGIAGTGTGSASGSKINTQTPNDPVFVTIKSMDICPRTGASSGAFVQAVQGAFGYTSERGPFIGVGGFFEKPNTDTALGQWGVWGTLGYGF